MDNSFWVRSDRFHLKDKSKYIVDAWLNKDQAISIRLDEQQLDYEVEESDALQEDVIGRFVKIIVFLPESLDSYRTLKIVSLDDGKEEVSFEVDVPTLLQKKIPIQTCYDKIDVDFATRTCRVEGWIVSSEPVEIILTGDKNSNLPFEIERVKRRDVLAVYPEYDLEQDNGFVITFNMETIRKAR